MFCLWLTTKFSQCTVKEKVIRILMCHNQLSNSSMKTIYLDSTLSMKNSLLQINYNENVGEQSKKYSVKT